MPNICIFCSSFLFLVIIPSVDSSQEIVVAEKSKKVFCGGGWVNAKKISVHIMTFILTVTCAMLDFHDIKLRPPDGILRCSSG